jgi:hypothetical protein
MIDETRQSPEDYGMISDKAKAAILDKCCQKVDCLARGEVIDLEGAPDLHQRSSPETASAWPTDEQVWDSIRLTFGEKIAEKLSFKRWKDGIDIDHPTHEAMSFARQMFAMGVVAAGGLAQTPAGGEIEFEYCNWEGRKSLRRARPISIRFGKSEWHPTPQWLMRAFDPDKGEEREFAMQDMAFEEDALAALSLSSTVRRACHDHPSRRCTPDDCCQSATCDECGKPAGSNRGKCFGCFVYNEERAAAVSVTSPDREGK